MFSCKKDIEPRKQDVKLISEDIKLTAKEIYSKDVNNTVTIFTSSGLGSGFFIDTNLIITNYHVIKGENKAEVQLNNSDKRIAVLGYLSVDKINDLVLLKIDYNNKNYIKLENEIPEAGEKVFAIGSPIGLNKTISEGIVSGIRNFEARNLLQITTPISHGSSGCPIINEKGKVVGVAVGGIEESSNIGFCIPTNYIKSLIDFKENYPKDISKLKSSDFPSNDTQGSNENDNSNNNDSPDEIIESKPSKSVNNTINRIYLGKHLFEAYTIGLDETFGTATITYVNDTYYIDAYQKNDKGYYIKLNGTIEIENIDKFYFTGKIIVNNLGYNSNTKRVDTYCEWDGTAIFQNKGGAYWRCQGTSEGVLEMCWNYTSYIDIFVKVNPNYKTTK